MSETGAAPNSLSSIATFCGERIEMVALSFAALLLVGSYGAEARGEPSEDLASRIESLRLASVPLPRTSDELVVDPEQALEVFLAPSDFPDAVVRLAIDGQAAEYALNFDFGQGRGEALPRRVRWPRLNGRVLRVEPPPGGCGMELVGGREAEPPSGELRLTWYLRPLESEEEDGYRARVVGVVLSSNEAESRPFAAWVAPSPAPRCQPATGLAPGALRCRAPGVTRTIRALALDPSGRWIAVAGGDLRPRVDLWDRRTYDISRRIAFPPWLGAPLSAAFTADGDSLVVIDAGGAVHRWDTVTTGRHRRIDARAEAGVIVNMGREVAVATAGGGLVVWRLADGTISRRLGSPRGAARTVLVASGDGLRVAGLRGGEGGDVMVWELESGRQVARLGGPELTGLTGLLLDGPGERLFATHETRGLLVAPVRGGGSWSAWGGAVGRRCRGSLALSPDHQTVACALDHGAAVLSLSDGHPVRLLDDREGPWLDAVTFSPEGDALIGAGEGSLWEWVLLAVEGTRR